MLKGDCEMKKLMHEEGGFTLVELLVTIAILGVLFGIVTLSLGGLTTDAQANSCTAELAVVQSAADIYLAVDLTNTIAGRAVGAEDVIDTGDAEFDTYLRSLPTYADYWWTTAGDVTQTDCPSNG
jgi:prepilin-type N-terminal cleavage/methylation domain-containing protein